MTINLARNSIDGICLGVPAVIGRQGIKSIWNLELNEDEKTKLKKSADQIKNYL